MESFGSCRMRGAVDRRLRRSCGARLSETDTVNAANSAVADATASGSLKPGIRRSSKR